LQVGENRHRFGGDRDAGQAETAGDFAVVGEAAARQEGGDGLQPDAEAESGGVLHGAHQHRGVDHRFVRLREGEAAGFDQLVHLGEAFALESDGERADGVDVGAVELLGAVAEHFHQTRLVEGGVGVGRDGDGGDAAGHRRFQFGFERGAVFEPRLAQARGEVDESGGDDESGGVERALGDETVGGGAEGGDFAVGDVDVLNAVGLVGGIDDPTVGYADFHRFLLPH